MSNPNSVLPARRQQSVQLARLCQDELAQQLAGRLRAGEEIDRLQRGVLDDGGLERGRQHGRAAAPLDLARAAEVVRVRVGDQHAGQLDVQRRDVFEDAPGCVAIQAGVHQQRLAVLHQKAGVGAGPQMIDAIVSVEVQARKRERRERKEKGKEGNRIESSPR